MWLWTVTRPISCDPIECQLQLVPSSASISLNQEMLHKSNWKREHQMQSNFHVQNGQKCLPNYPDFPAGLMERWAYWGDCIEVWLQTCQNFYFLYRVCHCFRAFMHLCCDYAYRSATLDAVVCDLCSVQFIVCFILSSMSTLYISLVVADACIIIRSTLLDWVHLIKPICHPYIRPQIVCFWIWWNMLCG